MRLTSEFWVSAYLRRCFAEGIMGAVVKRGASEAGAVFIKVNRLDGTADLYGPAAKLHFSERKPTERLFSPVYTDGPVAETEIDAKLLRERNFDPDLWVVEVEDRDGRHFLDLA